MAKRLLSSGAVGGLALVAVLVTNAGRGNAQTFSATVASDTTAGYVVFPDVFVNVPACDTTIGHCKNSPTRSCTSDANCLGPATDTLVQLTNTANAPRVAHCFYVDATRSCIDGLRTACESNADCSNDGGVCEPPVWSSADFTVTLSPHQPLGWSANSGDLANNVRPVPGNPFVGELKCVEVDAFSTITPINANDLKGEATTETVASGASASLDAREYNAIGIQTIINDGTTQSETSAQAGTAAMCLGANSASSECKTAEYASCPQLLILDNFFDGTVGSTTNSTQLVLVPCTENLVNNTTPKTTAQFLVYNEFEQRFSTATAVNCFAETTLSGIDSPLDPNSSIFSFAVQGTLTGQTRIRPVPGADPENGNGLLGIAELFETQGGVTASSAYHLNYSGVNPNTADFVRYSLP